jgi:hypothetical protein
MYADFYTPIFYRNIKAGKTKENPQRFNLCHAVKDKIRKPQIMA